MKGQQIEVARRIERFDFVSWFLDKLLYNSVHQILHLSDIILIRPTSLSCCQNDVVNVKTLHKFWSNKQICYVSRFLCHIHPSVGFQETSISGSSLEIFINYHRAEVWCESFPWFLCSSLSISSCQVPSMHSSCGLRMWQQGGHGVLNLSKWNVIDSVNALQVRAEDLWAEIRGSVREKRWPHHWCLRESFLEEMKFEAGEDSFLGGGALKIKPL